MNDENQEQVEYVLAQSEKYEKSLINQKKKWLIQKCYFLKYEIKQRDKQRTAIVKNHRIALRKALAKAAIVEKKNLLKKDKIIEELKKRITSANDRAYNHTRATKLAKLETQKLKIDLEELKSKVSPYRDALKERLLGFLLTYAYLEKEGIITYSELMILTIGAQSHTFRYVDLIDSIKGLRHAPRTDLLALTRAGYIKKVHRQRAWYITVAGQDRLNSILEFIEEKEIEFYHEKPKERKPYTRKLPIVNN